MISDGFVWSNAQVVEKFEFAFAKPLKQINVFSIFNTIQSLSFWSTSRLLNAMASLFLFRLAVPPMPVTFFDVFLPAGPTAPPLFIFIEPMMTIDSRSSSISFYCCSLSPSFGLAAASFLSLSVLFAFYCGVCYDGDRISTWSSCFWMEPICWLNIFALCEFSVIWLSSKPF